MKLGLYIMHTYNNYRSDIVRKCVNYFMPYTFLPYFAAALKYYYVDIHAHFTFADTCQIFGRFFVVSSPLINY